MRKLSCFIFTAVSAMIFASPQGCCAGNLLINPGFESGDYPPDGWDDWSGSESDAPERNGIAGFQTPKELARSGNKGVGKILYGTGERWGGFSQTIDVPGGGNFKAEGWMKNNKNDVALGKGARAYIEVKFLDGAEEEIKKVKSSSLRQSAGWTKFSVMGVAPGKARKAIFSFVLVGPKGSRGKVFFDDAALAFRD